MSLSRLRQSASAVCSAEAVSSGEFIAGHSEPAKERSSNDLVDHELVLLQGRRRLATLEALAFVKWRVMLKAYAKLGVALSRARRSHQAANGAASRRFVEGCRGSRGLVR
jgi:hypothetical protein